MRTFTDLRFCSSHSIDCVIYQNVGPTVCMHVWIFFTCYYFLLLFHTFWPSKPYYALIFSIVLIFFPNAKYQMAMCECGCVSLCVNAVHVRFRCKSGSAAVAYFIFQYCSASIANLNAFPYTIFRYLTYFTYISLLLLLLWFYFYLFLYLHAFCYSEKWQWGTGKKREREKVCPCFGSSPPLRSLSKLK